jgi:hypothetical protein
MSFMHDTPPMVPDKINRPSQMRWAIRCNFAFPSTSKAALKDPGGVMIIIGEEDLVLHGSGSI